MDGEKMFVFQAIFGPTSSSTGKLGIEQMIVALKGSMEHPMEGEANVLAPKILSLIKTWEDELAKPNPDRTYLNLLEKQIRMSYNYVKELRESPEEKKREVANAHIPGLKENEKAINEYKASESSGFVGPRSNTPEKKIDYVQKTKPALKGEDDRNLSAALTEIRYFVSRGNEATAEDKKRLEAKLEKIYSIANYFEDGNYYHFFDAKSVPELKVKMKNNGVENALASEDENSIILLGKNQKAYVTLGDRDFIISLKDNGLVVSEKLGLKDAVRRGHYAEASKVVEEVCKRWFATGDLVALSFYKADYYLIEKKFDLAIEYATKAISLDPKDWESYELRGDIYYENKEYGKALEDYRKAFELNDVGMKNELAKKIEEAETKLRESDQSGNVKSKTKDATTGSAPSSQERSTSTSTSDLKITSIPLDALMLRQFIDDFAGKFLAKEGGGYENKNSLLVGTLTYLQSKGWLDANAVWTGKDATTYLEAIKSDPVKMALVKEAFALAYGRGAKNMKASLDRLAQGTDAAGALAAFTDGTIADAMTTTTTGNAPITKAQMKWWRGNFTDKSIITQEVAGALNAPKPSAAPADVVEAPGSLDSYSDLKAFREDWRVKVAARALGNDGALKGADGNFDRRKVLDAINTYGAATIESGGERSSQANNATSFGNINLTSAVTMPRWLIEWGNRPDVATALEGMDAATLTARLEDVVSGIINGTYNKNTDFIGVLKQEETQVAGAFDFLGPVLDWLKPLGKEQKILDYVAKNKLSQQQLEVFIGNKIVEGRETYKTADELLTAMKGYFEKPVASGVPFDKFEITGWIVTHKADKELQDTYGSIPEANRAEAMERLKVMLANPLQYQVDETLEEARALMETVRDAVKPAAK
jgi:tetratricopeptide (TPR) repeat protein